MTTAARIDDSQVLRCPDCQSTLVLVRDSRARLRNQRDMDRGLKEARYGFMGLNLLETAIVSIFGIALISISVSLVLVFQTINGNVITRIDKIDQQIGTINETVNGNVSTEIGQLSRAISSDVTTQISEIHRTLNNYVASQSRPQATPGPLRLTTSCSSDPSGGDFRSISSCPVTVRVETPEGSSEEIVLGDASLVNRENLPERYLALSAVRPGYKSASLRVILARQTVGQVVTISLERLP